jgi:CRISPR system Cascade subunit CasE
MYMSKIELDMAKPSRLGVYEAHQALWKLFSDSPDRERDFLYRRLDTASFLTVSRRRPDRRGFVHTMQSKEYAPVLSAGDRLMFSLRFNPVVKRRNENGRQVRVDMVQDERQRLMREGAQLPPRPEIAEGVAETWLDKRRRDLGLSPEPASLMVESYDQVRFRRHGGKRPVVLSCIDVRGFAAVDDTALLERALFNGVGCAKGFGFGLLLIRRA